MSRTRGGSVGSRGGSHSSGRSIPNPGPMSKGKARRSPIKNNCEPSVRGKRTQKPPRKEQTVIPPPSQPTSNIVPPNIVPPSTVDPPTPEIQTLPNNASTFNALPIVDSVPLLELMRQANMKMTNAGLAENFQIPIPDGHSVEQVAEDESGSDTSSEDAEFLNELAAPINIEPHTEPANSQTWGTISTPNGGSGTHSVAAAASASASASLSHSEDAVGSASG